MYLRTVQSECNYPGTASVRVSSWGDDDDLQPPIILIYNTVRGYVSAIHGLLAHQVSRGLHQAPEPHRVAIKALEISVVRGEHERRRKEYTDRKV